MNKPTERENLDILEQHFRDGCKLNCVQKLGVEIEHFIVRSDSGESVTYYEEQGIESILRELAPEFPRRHCEDGHLLGLYNNDYAISLEPAGQLEVSIVPKESICVIQKIYQSFLKQLYPLLKRRRFRLVTLGYQPVSQVDSLPLIPKKRYEYMDHHFQTAGTRGRNMMRGTAATQVSIDYDSEKDFVLKIRSAYMLMPLLKLLTDNTPVMDGEAYEGHMARTYIWDNVDPDRTGIIPGLFDEDFGFEKYAEFLLNMPVIFVENQGTPIYTGDQKTEEIWKETLFGQEDIEHILSMNFQDVRLKHYLEIRYADSMPINCVLGYAALIKGVFYQEEFLKELHKKLRPDEESIRQTQKNLMENGFDGTAYGYPADKLLKYVMEGAKNRLCESEQLLLRPLEKLTEQKKTLAGEYFE